MGSRSVWTEEDIRGFFRQLPEQSRFLHAVKRLKARDEGGSVHRGLRSLGEDEVKILEKNGNVSSNWENIRVTPGFDCSLIHRSRLEGAVVIGDLSPERVFVAEDTALPGGIWNSVIIDSEIGGGCAVYDVTPLSSTIVEEGCGILDASIQGREGNFGNELVISPGAETGGRSLPVFADLHPRLLEFLLFLPKEDPRWVLYRREWEKIRDSLSFSKTIISRGARIFRGGAITASFLGEGVMVKGGAVIENSTLLSTADEPVLAGPGARIRNSLIQSGCEVTTQALVDDSLLFEHSTVERQGKVSLSVLSPNTGVGEGEVTASYLGPFVGFHHQSLLISALWPDGKGNVGAGANIGSNHTSRAPDQELFPGEGMFFGIGCCIKYPGDYRRAPYSIVVTGTTTLPQKVEFPFSLITPPSKYYEISPVFNRLIPGWGVLNNMYFLVRNEDKYRKRNRSRNFTWPVEIFREDIIRMVIDARRNLSSVPERKILYKIEDIPGLGKNFMLEEDRKNGLEAYDFCIDYYCCKEVRALLPETGHDAPAEAADVWDRLFAGRDKTKSGERAFLRELLIQRGWKEKGLSGVLQYYLHCLGIIRQRTEDSKRKDDLRGTRIQSEYMETHVAAGEDRIVSLCREKERDEQRALRGILAL